MLPNHKYSKVAKLKENKKVEVNDLILLLGNIPPPQLSWDLSKNSVKTSSMFSFEQPKMV